MFNVIGGDRKKRALLNILFLLVCCAMLLFLLNAPKETTSKLPHDPQHIRFQSIKNKKDAEKFCEECHFPNGQAPLPDNHPPKFRCLLCHKTT